jgi:hypothetical protein
VSDLPRLTERMLDVESYAGPRSVWPLVARLAAKLRPDEWLLVGGQMVALHGFAVGMTMTRTTQDVDMVADVLVRRAALQNCVAAVEAEGLEPRPTLDNRRLHRWVGTLGIVESEHSY